MTRRPLLIASECFSGLFPQNSLTGFCHALEADVDGIEFDVHLSRDGQVIVQHDYRLNPDITRDRSGQWITPPGPPVVELDSDALRGFDIGRYRPGSREETTHPDYTPVDGEPIPRLEQFLEAHARVDRAPALWIELKTTPLRREISSDPTRLLHRVLDLVERAGVTRRTMLLAFEWPVLTAAMDRCPGIATDFLTVDPSLVRALNRSAGPIDPALLYGEFNPADYGGSIPAAIHAAGGRHWGPYFGDIDARDVASARASGIAVHAWGIADQHIDAALALGTDSLTLARPDLAARRLARPASTDPR